MDGVSAVRAYTLLAVVALLAGGWMLNEAPSTGFDEDESTLRLESDFAAEPAIRSYYYVSNAAYITGLCE